MAPLGFGGWREGSRRVHLQCLFLAAAMSLLGPVRGQQCVASQNPEVLQFTDLGANSTMSVVARTEPATWGSLYSMVHLFLDTVQPNDFPEDLLRDALNNSSSIRTSQVAKYEAGFVVCAVIAGLYLILMVLTGLIFFIGRWRGRWRGLIENFNKNLVYRRNTLILALLLTTLLMLAGVICAFATNERTTKEMEPSIRVIPNSLQGFRLFLDNIPQAVNTIVSEFSIPKQKVIEDLKTAGQSIGNSLSSKVNVTVLPLLLSALKTAQDLQDSVKYLQDLQNTTQNVQQRQAELETALSDQRQKLNLLLVNPNCVSCVETLRQVADLELVANFSKVPSLDLVSNLEDAAKIDMTAVFQKAIESFRNIPAMVEEKSAEGIQSTLNALNRAETDVRAIAEKLRLDRFISPLSTALSKGEVQCTKYGEEVKRYDYYRWIVGIVLCSVVLLIIVCNLVGLSLGLWGLYLRGDPTEETFQGETGASVLISGTGLSFFFSWLLILLVFATFLVGGNVQTLVCKSWSDGTIYRFLDEPGNLPPSMNLSKILGLNQNINISSIYQQCKEGAVFWDILPISNNFNIEDSLNISKYTADFLKNANNITIDLSDFDMVKTIAFFWFGVFTSSGMGQVNYSQFEEEIQSPLVKTSLVNFAAQLESLATFQTDTNIQTQMTAEAAALRQLQAVVVEQAADVAKMNESVQVLSVFSPRVESLTNKATEDILHIETFLTVDLQLLLKNEIECFVKKELGYFVQYVDWVNRTIVLEVATCRPISASLDNARVAVCENVLNPWNAFWFSLGWCTLLLIPSIIFAVKTSKYFRPIRRSLRSSSSSVVETPLST
ncbi:prominin-2 isoform X1 [Lissotriton helveticus]